MKTFTALFSAKLLFVACCAVMLTIMYWRLQLGEVRYYDADEFMYLNWAAHIAQGHRPYLDFLMHVGPVYPLIVSILFWFGDGLTPVIWARILAWAMSVGLCLSAVILFWQIRRSWVAIVAGLILAVLPMPSDKLLEIRPDILAITLIIVGYVFIIRFFRTEKWYLLLLGGTLLSTAFLTIQKMFPSLVIATGFLIVFFTVKKLTKSKRIYFVCAYCAGVFMPFIVLTLWALIHGGIGTVYYDLFRLPVEHLQGVVRFNQLPWNFYFLPNPTYYGQWEIGPGLVFNHLIWILAFVLGISRFISIYFMKNNVRRIEEGMITTSLFAYGIFYVWLSPLKFPQYLIPVAVFVSWFSADWIDIVWQTTKKIQYIRSVFVLLGIIGLCFSLWIFRFVHTPKFVWTNAPHKAKMQKIFSTIPMNSYVLDLEGRTIYYPYPHPVCCLAFGQFEEFLSRPLSTYAQALSQTKTKYIYQAEINRISALSPVDQQFIYDNYRSVENGELWMAKNW